MKFEMHHVYEILQNRDILFRGIGAGFQTIFLCKYGNFGYEGPTNFENTEYHSNF